MEYSIGMEVTYYFDMEQLSQYILQSWKNLHKPKLSCNSTGGGYRWKSNDPVLKIGEAEQ